MTVFIRCVDRSDKHHALLHAITSYRNGLETEITYHKNQEDFTRLPSTSISYWAPESAIAAFAAMPPLENEKRIARSTNDSGDDMRFVRASWEVDSATFEFVEWKPLCKGGEFSRYYSDVHLKICWNKRRETYLGFVGSKHRPLEKPASVDLFLRPGLTWSRRTALRLSMRAMPAGCLFAQKGPAIFCEGNDTAELLAALAITNSTAFYYFVDFQLGAANAGRAYDMGVIQRTPFPDLSDQQVKELSVLARKAWSAKRLLDTVNETSRCFMLPATLFEKLERETLQFWADQLDHSHKEIEEMAFRLYEFTEVDRATVLESSDTALANGTDDDASTDGEVEEANGAPIEQSDSLLSWAAGVAFGRFDWRLATGEREAPPEPDPFDPLPAKSPGMLPDGAEPFHAHSGILVDDQGHPNNLARLIEEVLARVEAPVPADVRRWLQRDFFPMHLRQYSKSRRKAPIYWPLSTSSGSYTLWLYYPSLTDQTLFTAVNDFIEPKLKQVGQDVAALRTKGSARSRDDEKTFEALQTLELELIELRDTLLAIAQTYRPNHDDGVQITAAPLWQLFRHKPWQKILNDTWAKLEKGDYDWAHLAMAYWPDRVREKCKTDKSLAIAHDLEHLYVEPEPTKARGRKKDG